MTSLQKGSVQQSKNWSYDISDNDLKALILPEDQRFFVYELLFPVDSKEAVSVRFRQSKSQSKNKPTIIDPLAAIPKI